MSHDDIGTEAVDPGHDDAGRVAGAFSARRPLVLLAIALASFAISAWSERQQEHSHHWKNAGDRFMLTSFLAPWHHHTREIPHSGITEIVAQADPSDPGDPVLLLRYGMVDFFMPSQGEHNIRRFDGYVERLRGLLEEVRAGDDEASMLYLDPYLMVMAAAALVSVVCWIALFVVILRPRP